VSDDFLSRWSRRKHEARNGAIPVETGIEPEAAAPLPTDAQKAVSESAPEPLPPVESLTPESDFTPFMKADVDPGVKREALKTLFADPRFNVMDGLDVYIDDYSKPDPLPAGWLEKMTQVARLGDYKPPLPKEEQEEAESAESALQEDHKPEMEQTVDDDLTAHPDGAPEPSSPPPESKDS